MVIVTAPRCAILREPETNTQSQEQNLEGGMRSAVEERWKQRIVSSRRSGRRVLHRLRGIMSSIFENHASTLFDSVTTRQCFSTRRSEHLTWTLVSAGKPSVHHLGVSEMSILDSEAASRRDISPFIREKVLKTYAHLGAGEFPEPLAIETWLFMSAVKSLFCTASLDPDFQVFKGRNCWL